MKLHLIKLAVGVEDVAHLAQLQKDRVSQAKAQNKWDRFKSSPRHITRQRPRREDELLDGGSIYWVIKGAIRARQEIIAMDEVPLEASDASNGRIPKPKCALVLNPTIVPILPRKHRAFQGWRYLDAAKAPNDAGAGGAEMPDDLAADLGELGLL